MNAASFKHWERLREQREGGAVARWLVAFVAGGVLAALVEWRAQTGVVAASHLWLAGACAAFVVAFMRVPVQIYWRKDAAMLAQLPIEGGVLFDAALRRCMRAAIATLVVPVLGAIPLALLSPEVVNKATRTLDAIPFAGDPVPRLVPLELFARHAGFAIAFALIAACFIPAVTMWAATLVASSKDLLQVATKLGGAPARETVPGLASGGQVLGAIPGFASSVAFVVLFMMSPWLVNREATIDANVGLIAIAIGSILPLVLLRARVAAQMGDILRDVSALDRQRLAFIEVLPLTAIERLVAKLSGAALAYSKDARLIAPALPDGVRTRRARVHHPGNHRLRAARRHHVARRDVGWRRALRDRARPPPRPTADRARAPVLDAADLRGRAPPREGRVDRRLGRGVRRSARNVRGDPRLVGQIGDNCGAKHRGRGSPEQAVLFCSLREHVERANAGLDRAAIAGAALEQAHDLGAAPWIDIDDQRRDICEHEVEP